MRHFAEVSQDVEEVMNRHVEQNVLYNVYYSAA